MGLFLGTAMAAFSSVAWAEDVTVSFLTHWPPETVAKLEAAAATYAKDHPGVNVEVRAVPFGDLLTTLRSQAGQAGGPTITGIYD
ncbi:MAG: extracellular solute-binding protein, partial [Rhizobiales bacterium]|nr:extracellular solute-binding protein [Hyphomicrobiales bacterium]